MTSDISHGTFTCPECGSNYFGTSNCNLGHEQWVGHCHGYGCRFTWRRIDDEKCFARNDEGEDE